MKQSLKCSGRGDESLILLNLRVVDEATSPLDSNISGTRRLVHYTHCQHGAQLLQRPLANPVDLQ